MKSLYENIGCSYMFNNIMDAQLLNDDSFIKQLSQE